MSEKNCILIVDDDEGVRKSLTLILRKKGYLVESAATGKEALAIAQGMPVNLTLLDVKLPDIMGTQLLAPLKQTNPDMSVIMITGFASVENAVQSLSTGASAYIIKPIDLDDMLARIKTTLDQQHLITEVRRAEDALRESEKKFHTMADFTYDWELWLGQDRQIIYCSPSCERITGYSPEAFIADPQLLMKIVHPDDLRLMEEHNSTAWETQNVLSVDFRIIYRDGSVRWICQQVTAGDGTLLGRRVSNRDITKRKRAEVTLKESETYLKIIFNSVQIGLLIIDPVTHSICDANPAALELLGRIKNKLIGTICHESVCPAERGKCPITDLGQKIDNSERILLRANGKPIPILKKVVPIIIQGRSYLLESLVDISERKEAEEKIALANRKLTLMNDVAYQDIQNKITALRGYVELRKNANSVVECKSFIGNEQLSLAAIHHIIENTKEYQKMGLNKPEWLSVERSIRTGASMISKKYDVDVEIEIHGLEIHADTLIDQIFYNFIENTIKHGKTATRISFSCKDTNNEVILICEDDGIGIPLIEKDRIFDRVVGGQGRFGLFFVREYLSLFGISITETGEPGKGARFEITVPERMWRVAGNA